MLDVTIVVARDLPIDPKQIYPAVRERTWAAAREAACCRCQTPLGNRVADVGEWQRCPACDRLERFRRDRRVVANTFILYGDQDAAWSALGWEV